MADYVSADVETAAYLAREEEPAAIDELEPDPGERDAGRHLGTQCRNRACEMFGWRMHTTHCHSCGGRLRPANVVEDLVWMEQRGIRVAERDRRHVDEVTARRARELEAFLAENRGA